MGTKIVSKLMELQLVSFFEIRKPDSDFVKVIIKDNETYRAVEYVRKYGPNIESIERVKEALALCYLVTNDIDLDCLYRIHLGSI